VTSTREEPRFRVADVVRRHGARFRARHGGALTHEQGKALDDIVRCRTAALGGHIAVYDCGHEVIAYNSCRSRHCPRCLAGRAREWVDEKEADLLPVPYFHVVFTLPPALLDVPAVARPALYEALFAASSSTLLRFGREQLGGQLGFLSVLHTWGQTLTLHPHVHCVVAGGAFDVDKKTWTPSRERFLFPVRALSKVFRGKMLERLRKKGLPGVDDDELARLLAAAADVDWVVYAKPPFGGPAQVLRYLARYTHRVAIGDGRIVDVDDDTVSFSYKDYRDAGARKVMTLDGVEWLRRFSQHVLPRGFTRLRSYGFLANTKKAEKLAAIRAVLGVAAPADDDDIIDADEPCRCPVCGIGLLKERRPAPLAPLAPKGADTS
jgi:hypothetical protein